MEELIKKFVYTGVGIVAFTAEKVKEVVDKLVAEEKLTEEEGKKIVDEFLSNTESKKEEFEGQVRALFGKAQESFNKATAGKGGEEIEDLKARIEALEAKQKTTRTTAAAKKTEDAKA